MLFVFGDFLEQGNLSSDISGQLFPVVTSKFLKFTYGEFGIVFHFRSTETFVELKEYIGMVMDGITEQYFLMEVPKNMDIKMERKLKRDFLSIDEEPKKEENKNGAIDIEELKELRRKEFKNIAFEFILPIVEQNDFFDKTEEKKPTVDEILDKITDKGIESLTELEKQILENYGKDENGRN